MESRMVESEVTQYFLDPVRGFVHIADLAGDVSRMLPEIATIKFPSASMATRVGPEYPRCNGSGILCRFIPTPASETRFNTSVEDPADGERSDSMDIKTKLSAV